MNLKQINYVLTVLECGSFSAAAKKLFIAQSSLSQYIINIERSLGATIFNRSSAPLTLTKVGELYVQTAKEYLELDHRFKQQLSDLSDTLQGNVSVGTSQFITTHILPHILSEFMAKYPLINISLVELGGDSRENAALAGKLDLFFTYSAMRPDVLEYVPIAEEQLLWAIPPSHPLNNSPLGEAASISLTQDLIHYPPFDLRLLAAERFILLFSSLSLGERAEDICQKAGFVPQVVLRSKSLDAIHSMVCVGLGCSILPESMARFTSGTTSPVYYETGEHRTLYLAHLRNHHLSRAANEFINASRKIYQEMFSVQ